MFALRRNAGAALPARALLAAGGPGGFAIRPVPAHAAAFRLQGMRQPRARVRRRLCTCTSHRVAVSPGFRKHARAIASGWQ
eukprot:1511046-Prymnesium_polylepis.1